MVRVGEEGDHLHAGVLRGQRQAIQEGFRRFGVWPQEELPLRAAARDHVDPSGDDSARHRHAGLSAVVPARCGLASNLGASQPTPVRLSQPAPRIPSTTCPAHVPGVDRSRSSPAPRSAYYHLTNRIEPPSWRAGAATNPRDSIVDPRECRVRPGRRNACPQAWCGSWASLSRSREGIRGRQGQREVRDGYEGDFGLSPCAGVGFSDWRG